MTEDEIFDSEYVDDKQSTKSIAGKSIIKEFLKDAIQEKEVSEKYGSSKPKRVVIKAKLTNG